MCKAEDAHGFVEGQQYSLDEFEKTASAFKKNFFGGQAAAKKVSAVQHTPQSICCMQLCYSHNLLVYVSPPRRCHSTAAN